ncbi:hypothetical protein HMPREF9144_0109 [Prevotella pallens ATCC 700821]|uniref:Uncharacterized protein n=1 Tax=Prevotella pallens ATCC 700821 TaxID=997353 RepID=F9DEL9_9BACT|nr:hypothetical protein HMPREF9144_0109 [Prevotella pallens ATCC 700821]
MYLLYIIFCSLYFTNLIEKPTGMFVKEFNYNEIRSNTIKFLTIY